MIQNTPVPFSLKDLFLKISEFELTASRFHTDFSIEHLRSEISRARVIKQNDRRQVYYFHTAGGGYYLKLSALIRSKDRLRHFFLPMRRWAEWRNLHRLAQTGVPAAIPVMKGEGSVFDQKIFFLITEKVDGAPFRNDLPASAKILGRFLANLHARGLYYADLHPKNIILKPDNSPCLIDAQEVYFWPWLPQRWRVNNLAKLFSHLNSQKLSEKWTREFLIAYNQGQKYPLRLSELNQATRRYQDKRYRSRVKRCFKNSTEFEILSHQPLSGYRRRAFGWTAQDLRNALDKGVTLKPDSVRCYQDVCVKIHHRKLFHRDRCLNSWKMSRVLDVRNIMVPQALAYFRTEGKSYFLSQYLQECVGLNEYLSSIRKADQKRAALKKLAQWLKRIHRLGIWQHDLKSSNVLHYRGEYVLIDLDGVCLRRLSHHHKIMNLAQLNASLSNAVSLKDRLRFYSYYLERETAPRIQRRALYQKVWQITTQKNTMNFDLDLEKLCPRTNRYPWKG
jgi:tRNA A-37 threonylcarbamoyl transferase component Bud32